MFMTEVLRIYTTVNSSTKMAVIMSAVSHVIDNKSDINDSNQNSSCWIHFRSGKSVHIRADFNDVMDDIEEYYKTHE